MAIINFAARAAVNRNDDRTIRTFTSECKQAKVVEIKSNLDGAHYWLAVHVLASGEYPIQLPDRKAHGFRTQTAAEQACATYLASKDLVASPQPLLWSDEPMTTKTKTTKAKASKATKAKGAKKPAPATKPAPAKKPTSKTKAPAGDATKKLGALDAAAQVLAKAKEPMTSHELIASMANLGLWTSPGGKTPHATLYAAMIREIANKGKDARFKKSARGKFAAA